MKALSLLLLLLCLHAPAPGRAQEEADTIVVDREEIEKMGFHRIQDLLNQLPGVKAGDSSISLRGSYKVKVLLDGRPINDPTSSHGAVKWELVPLENVEAIEIHKGKGGVEYGDDSSGGVVLVTTRKIQALHGSAEAYWGNYDTQSYHFNSQGNKGRWGAGISAAYEATDNYRENYDKEKERVGVRFEYVPSTESRMNLSADYLQEDSGQPGLPAYPTPHARQQDKTISSALTANLGGLLSKAYFSGVQRDNQDPDKKLDTSIQVQKIGEEVNTAVPIGNWGKVNGGAGIEYSQATGNQFDRKEEQSYWVFLAKQVPLQSLPLTFSVGLRGILYSEFGEVVNPEFQTTFKQPWYTLQFVVNRTNNIPSFLQRYNETSSTIPNPDLTMEKATNFSLSAIPKLPEPFSGSVSLFYNLITDRITYVRGDGGIGQYQNFGDVTYKGAEFALGWQPLKTLNIKSSYTYLEAIDEATGNWLAAKPQHSVNADIMYAPVPDLSLAFSVKYCSLQYTRSDNTESVPGYFIGDLRAEYRWRRGIGLFSEIRNLWDRQYYYGDGYPAPPLTWVLGLNYQF